jgi:alcohol dehydrogenase (cytochrome c)
LDAPVLEGLTGTYQGKETTMTGKANESWPGDMYKFGGGAPWLGGTYDPDTKLAYFGTGNPAPWNSWLRAGDNKWTSSRIAIDPENGEIKWGFQTTPHDGWDFDGVNEFISFDTKDGQKLGATADRNGFFYVLDRTNGKFLHATPFVSKITWAKGIDANGRPIYVDEVRPGDPTKSADGKEGKEAYAVPSFLGGKNQMPMAYSQNTGWFYVPSNEWGMDIHNEPVAYKKGAAYLGAGFTIHTIFDDHIGSLKAIDPADGSVKWEYKNRAPLWGGVLTTASGLVVTGTPEGYLKIFDDKTGEVLWQFNVGTGIVAPPIAWEQDGQEMIGVAAGWGGAVPLWGGDVARMVKDINQGGSYWVFRLPQKTAAN